MFLGACSKDTITKPVKPQFNNSKFSKLKFLKFFVTTKCKPKTLQILAHTDMLMRRDCKMVFWITFVLLHMLLIFDVLGCFFSRGDFRNLTLAFTTRGKQYFKGNLATLSSQECGMYQLEIPTGKWISLSNMWVRKSKVKSHKMTVIDWDVARTLHNWIFLFWTKPVWSFFYLLTFFCCVITSQTRKNPLNKIPYSILTTQKAISIVWYCMQCGFV